LTLEADIASEGFLVAGRCDTQVKNPKIQFAGVARATIIRCDAELGLTPKSREGITAEIEEAVDPENAALFGDRG
jgi:phage terminase small subunit